MPAEHVAGGGRDPAFRIPQYFADVNGLRTAVSDSGGPGPVLVFVHGLAGNMTHWVHVAPHFTDRFRVIGIDLPGCGESARIDQRYSVHMYSEHVVDTLDVMGVGRAAMVGHSLGGMVLTQLALLRPERAERLVLVNPAGFLHIPAGIRALGHLFLREGILNTVLPRAWKLLLDNVFEGDNHFTQGFVRVQEETYDPATDIFDVSRVIADLRQDFLTRNFLSVLHEVEVPMAVIWGSEDKLVPAGALQRATAKVRNAVLRELPGVGHMPIIEVPHHVVSFLEHVLAEHHPGRRAA
jgi:pimeloyl-ACP methyl ester carboxylesterase